MIPRASSAIAAPMFNEAIPTPSVMDWTLASRDQLMLGGLVAFGLVVLMLALRAFGQRMIASQSEAEHVGWKSVIGRVLARTTIIFMVVVAIDLVATYAAPPPRAQRVVDIFFIIAFALQGAIWARELILAMIARKVGDDPGATTLGNAMSLIRVLTSVALFAIAIIVILDNLGVNVTALVAGLGIGGIAIGLAAQGIFSDLFAALAILFDKPFRRGDMIRFDKTTAKVERIGLKTTRMRALSGEQVIMANTKLLEREIHNLADGRSRRTALPFTLAFQTPSEILAIVPDVTRAAVEQCKGCKYIRCVLTAFTATGFEYELVFENRSLDGDRLASDRSAILLTIASSFAAQNIAFAPGT